MVEVTGMQSLGILSIVLSDSRFGVKIPLSERPTRKPSLVELHIICNFPINSIDLAGRQLPSCERHSRRSDNLGL